ncbi:unnamed protein product [Paramecium sonneborni]|uniref:C2 domain-containing protein n=1 Tax=Paramecium sonneborni TaxID=65129 RepID=A0A8S1KKT7_9CILI|nr:unnamed protein product [Paramecium sonneborni]
MYKISILSVTFPNNKNKQDIYCKLTEGDQIYQTKVDMDTITIAKWDQNFNVKQTQSEIIFSIHLWKGENKDQLITETKVKWEQLLSMLNTTQSLKFNLCEMSLIIEEVTITSNEAQIKQFQKYLGDTGLEQSFKLIFAEILSKKIDRSEVFTYTALRLRQIGEDLKMFINNNHKMSQLLNNISEVQQDDEPDQFLESQDQ